MRLVLSQTCSFFCTPYFIQAFVPQTFTERRSWAWPWLSAWWGFSSKQAGPLPALLSPVHFSEVQSLRSESKTLPPSFTSPPPPSILASVTHHIEISQRILEASHLGPGLRQQQPPPACTSNLSSFSQFVSVTFFSPCNFMRLKATTQLLGLVL